MLHLFNKKSIYLLTFLFLVLLDQFLKYLMQNIFILYKKFGISFVFNKGSSFGIFSNFRYYNSFIIILSIFFLLFLAYYKEEFPSSFLLFFISGLVGNLIDRILYCAVRDIFVTPYFIFNLADFYLSISFIILFIDYYNFKKVKIKKMLNKLCFKKN